MLAAIMIFRWHDGAFEIGWAVAVWILAAVVAAGLKALVRAGKGRDGGEA